MNSRGRRLRWDRPCRTALVLICTILLQIQLFGNVNWVIGESLSAASAQTRNTSTFCFAGDMSQELHLVNAMNASIRIVSTDWRASNTRAAYETPCCRYIPASACRRMETIECHCIALRTTSCPTEPVFLSIGDPPPVVANTGIP